MPPKKKAANAKKRKNPADEDDKEAELAELRRQLEVANREKAQLEAEKARLEHGDREEESAAPSSRRARKLVRWNVDHDIDLLLAITHVCGLKGSSTKIPYGDVARSMGPLFTEGAITQHLTKLRARIAKKKEDEKKKAAEEGGSAEDTEAEGYLREPGDEEIEFIEDDNESPQRATRGIKRPTSRQSRNTRRESSGSSITMGSSDEDDEDEDDEDDFTLGREQLRWVKAYITGQEAKHRAAYQKSKSQVQTTGFGEDFSPSPNESFDDFTLPSSRSSIAEPRQSRLVTLRLSSERLAPFGDDSQHALSSDDTSPGPYYSATPPDVSREFQHQAPLLHPTFVPSLDAFAPVVSYMDEGYQRLPYWPSNGPSPFANPGLLAAQGPLNMPDANDLGFIDPDFLALPAQVPGPGQEMRSHGGQTHWPHMESPPELHLCEEEAPDSALKVEAAGESQTPGAPFLGIPEFGEEDLAAELTKEAADFVLEEDEEEWDFDL